MKASTLLQASARGLARMIREGEVSAREVCEAHIARIEAVNPALNAVVADRFTEARREADAADRVVREGGALPALHGVPCTVKESFGLAGMPNTSGLLARRHVVAAEDAPTVARLRQAGAIPLGVTNVSELCLWMESDNRVWGRTNNPWDVARTVGGSSGGEGCIVGAGGSPFGLGSDIGGSIRIPAFFNGVFGHKPSPGLVTNAGQYPAPGHENRLLGTGPLARRAEDLDLLLAVLSGGAVGTPAPVEAAELRVLVVEGDGRTQVDAALLDAQRDAADALASRGARVERLRVPGFERAFDLWAASMAEAADVSFNELLGQGQRLDPLAELGRFLVGRSPYTFPAVGLLAVEALVGKLEARRARALEEAAALRRRVVELLGDDAVLLYPPHPTTAPPHGRPMLFPFRFTYTAVFNVLELPVTQVPAGLDASGLPLGVQVAAAPGQDARTIAVARWLEEDLGGWHQPRVRVAEAPARPLQPEQRA